MHHFILPQYFTLGPLQIHFYGLCMALAVIAGYALAIKRAPDYGVSGGDADNLIFWLVIGGFAGARIYHIISSWSFYAAHPLNMLEVWHGGLSIYGAVVGGFIVLLIMTKFWRGNVLNYADWLAPSVALGQIIGRFGNMFNYELYGYPTNLPWKMYVPPQFRLPGYGDYGYFHPLFLYEILANAIILFLLLKVFRPRKSGGLFFWYLLLYNAVRFGLEFLRVDSTYFHGIRINAYVSLFLGIIAAIYLFFPWRNTINLSPSSSV